MQRGSRDGIKSNQNPAGQGLNPEIPCPALGELETMALPPVVFGNLTMALLSSAHMAPLLGLAFARNPMFWQVQYIGVSILF